MTHVVGIDVSVETSSICIVDETGLTVRELVVDSEPEALATARLATGLTFARVGLEARHLLLGGRRSEPVPPLTCCGRSLRFDAATIPVW